MRFISDAYWDRGMRDGNQDSISLQEVRMKGKMVVFALVCDGIGGLEQGEKASGFVAEKMTEWFYREAIVMLKRRKSRKKIEKSGLRILYGCNREMQRFGEENGSRMGTTVTAMILTGRHYFLWHSGDTLAYRITGKGAGGKIRRMTTDHTRDNVTLLRCIGSFPWTAPEVQSGYLVRKSVFLLCSDGFRNRLAEERIKEAFLPETVERKEQIYKRLKEMTEYVKGHGEKDNISAVAVRME